jgi:hypothetical protein
MHWIVIVPVTQSTDSLLLSSFLVKTWVKTFFVCLYQYYYYILSHNDYKPHNL